MDLQLSALARWCEQCGNLMASNRGIWPDATSGDGSFSNGVDLVPTRDGVVIS